MVTEEQAVDIARRLLGRPPDDASGPWHLNEFDGGWLVSEQLASRQDQYRGAATRVVERDTGRVVRFPSSVPPGRILEDYSRVEHRGRVESG